MWLRLLRAAAPLLAGEAVAEPKALHLGSGGAEDKVCVRGALKRGLNF